MGWQYTSRQTLPDLFDGGPSKRALREMARHGGDRMLEYTVMNTPIDSGNLRTSWRQKRVTVAMTGAGQIGYESGVETSVEYAPYVEEGTGEWGPHHAKYRIRAKGKAAGGADFLRFVIDGKVIFAKEVWHPGSPGALESSHGRDRRCDDRSTVRSDPAPDPGVVEARAGGQRGQRPAALSGGLPGRPTLMWAGRSGARTLVSCRSRARSTGPGPRSFAPAAR